MDYSRSDRVGDLLLELISELLTKEVGDPRIGPVTLTGVEISKDLRHARVYFSCLNGEEGRVEALSGLKSATGFIRRKVAGRLQLRFVPTLEFVYDETSARAQRIEDLLKRGKSG
ncbi:MAG: 30S ribosome-binding factor RbfA [Deltaproteobacteria bacterium]|nr:30S ribosome-binding factor RbfA [Deltaproteobacteria bacterium]